MKMGVIKLKRASFLNDDGFYWTRWNTSHTGYARLIVGDLDSITLVLVYSHGACVDACLAVDAFLLI